MDVLEHYIKLIQDIDAIDFGSMDQYIPDRMPSQVASHAQKYFARQRPGNMGKKRKRTSIHDITTDDLPPLGGVTP
ncbi:hypothetical protein CK203_113044 [Vitis vinifera]|uniref:Uncharacterized protein n=1 Tax=Vitis vinifera TaxID=29760 RepID=A0A438BLB2_VITVI|nr:hypothetical protein CK203_113044 [Vitis vinifera]